MTEETKTEKTTDELAKAICAILMPPHPFDPDPFERASSIQRFAVAAYQLFTITGDDEPAPTDKEIVAHFLGAAHVWLMVGEKKRFEEFFGAAKQLRRHPEGAFAKIKQVAEAVMADARKEGKL